MVACPRNGGASGGILSLIPAPRVKCSTTLISPPLTGGEGEGEGLLFFYLPRQLRHLYIGAVQFCPVQHGVEKLCTVKVGSAQVGLS